MPIKPDRKALYPANWSTEIRPRILARANNRCERCGVPNHERVFRFSDDDGAYYQMPDDGAIYCAESGEMLGYAHVVDLPQGRYIDIVLTIAHVHNPDPADCRDDNLAAWCQRCHNNHDRPMRMQNAAVTRRANSPTRDLFDDKDNL